MIRKLYRLLGWHWWKRGRNPYRRKCEFCGAQQDVHYIPGVNNGGWWETMNRLTDECKEPSE